MESILSAVKLHLSARAPGRSLPSRHLQAILLDLAYNIYHLKPCWYDRRSSVAVNGAANMLSKVSRRHLAPLKQPMITLTFGIFHML